METSRPQTCESGQRRVDVHPGEQALVPRVSRFRSPVRGGGPPLEPKDVLDRQMRWAGRGHRVAVTVTGGQG